MSAGDHAIVGGIVNSHLLEIDFGERQTVLEDAQEVLRRVAKYTKPVAMVHRVCNHPWPWYTGCAIPRHR